MQSQSLPTGWLILTTGAAFQRLLLASVPAPTAPWPQRQSRRVQMHTQCYIYKTAGGDNFQNTLRKGN